MTDYYVKNGGNDAADGLSDGNAWAYSPSMASASGVSDGTTLAAGDSVLFNKGDTWRETVTPASSGSAGSPITYGAYGTGNDPIISGGDILSTTEGDWTQEGVQDAYRITVNPSTMVYEAGVALTPVTSKTAMPQGSFYSPTSGVDNGETWVRTTDDSGPWTKALEANTRDSCVNIDTLSYIDIEDLDLKNARCLTTKTLQITDSSNINVTDCGVSAFVREGLRVTNSTSIILDGITATSPAAYTNYALDITNAAYGSFNAITIGIAGNAASACSDVIVRNCTASKAITGINTRFLSGSTITGNTVLNTANHGISVVEVTYDMTVSNNTVHDTGQYVQSNGIQLAGPTPPSLENSYNIVCTGNTVYNIGTTAGDRDGAGIILDVHSYNCTVSNNLIYTTDGAGIVCYYSHSSTVQYNVMYDTGNGSADDTKSGIHINASHDISVFNNTIYDPREYGLHLQGEAAPGQTYNITFKNNIVALSNTYAVQSEDVNVLTTGMDFDKNCYYFTSGTMADWNGTGYAALSNWQTGLTQDLESIDTDPLFINDNPSSDYDFHLQSTSPCIDTGVNVGLTRDFEGSGIVGLPDIGAYEYQYIIPPVPSDALPIVTNVKGDLYLNSPRLQLQGNLSSVCCGDGSGFSNDIQTRVVKLNSKHYKNTNSFTIKGPVTVSFRTEYPTKRYRTYPTGSKIFVGDPDYNFDSDRAEIRYTVNGDEPTRKSKLYRKAFTIRENLTGSKVKLKFKVFYKGKISKLATIIFNIKKSNNLEFYNSDYR